MGERSWVNCNSDLKSKKLGKQFIHRDGDLTWEEKLDNMLSPHFSWRPSEMPYSNAVASAINQNTKQAIRRQPIIPVQQISLELNGGLNETVDNLSISDICLDMRVRNAKFGLGTVKKIISDEFGKEITVLFDSIAIPKKIFLSSIKSKNSSSSKLERIQVSDLANAQFNKFVVRNKLEVNDLRPQGGALWVTTLTNDLGISKMLEDFGFTYKSSRRWWKE